MKFHKHPRLPNNDYTTGAYFITLCTFGRAQIFGRIVNDTNGRVVINADLDRSTQWVVATSGGDNKPVMELNETGQIVQQCWNAIPKHFPDVRMDQMQIMPDHLHGILVLTPDRSTQWVDATGMLERGRQKPKGPQPGSLGAIIGAFKSVTTKQITDFNAIEGNRIWQLGYHDRAIRKRNGEYERIAQYIEENPTNWR